jgi:hypothetical protein
LHRIIGTFIKTALLITIIISSMLALIIHYKGESFDPVGEIQLLISQERRDEARDIAEFFSNSKDSTAAIKTLQKKLKYTTLDKVRSFIWNGVIKGEVTDTYSGIGALGSDMVVLGDMRDLGMEAWNYITEDPDFDLVVLGLSLSGLVLSASPFVHASAVVKAMAKYIKRFPDLAKRGIVKLLASGKLSAHDASKIWELLKKTSVVFHVPLQTSLISATLTM